MKSNIRLRLSKSDLICPHCNRSLPINVGTFAGHPLPDVIVADEDLIVSILNSADKCGIGFCTECAQKFTEPTAIDRSYWIENDDRKSVSGPLCPSCIEEELIRTGNTQPTRRLYSATTTALKKLVGGQPNPKVNRTLLSKRENIQTLSEKLASIEIKKLV